MSFANNFWSRDYHQGLDALYSKLEQGCVENAEISALAQARAEIEDAYGRKLRDIKTNFAPKRSGFDRDDGASMRQAYVGILEEMSKEGQNHLQVSQNIRNMVTEPFGNWADEHAQRIDYSRQVTQAKVKEYERNLSEVNKAQKRYFNKCRVLEEMKEQEQELDSDESRDSGVTSEQFDANQSSVADGANASTVTVANTSSTAAGISAVDSPANSEATSQELTLNGIHYGDKEAQDLVSGMLKEIPKKDYKVPILGTYSDCSSGADIVHWIQLHLTGDIHKVESIGQDLVDTGVLRLVGQVGSKFANSSVMMYQWRPRASEIAGISFNTGVVDSFMGSSIGETIHERWQGYYRGTDRPEERLTREVRDLDQKYRKAVVILDNTRCQLEELLIDHFKFMQKCEADRLKALKAVALDLVASQSNVVPSIQASVDKQLLYQESMNPGTDLRYIIEAYQTGPMIPQVTIYDNYYSSSDGTIFGMDLELRARGDGKPVPYIVSTILAYLDKTYPRMENDEVRLSCWSEQAPLAQVNALRRELNLDVNFNKSILETYDAQVVVSILGTYLFQLPDSVLPSQHYDILKAIYSKTASEGRLTALQNTLAQLRVSNIATLDVLTSHVHRLITISKADDGTVSKIAKLLSTYLLRPQEYTPHTLNDTFGVQVVKDLVQNRDIFRELRKIAQPKRENSERRDPIPKDSNSRKERESVESRVSRIASSASRTSSHTVSTATTKTVEPVSEAAETESTADSPKPELFLPKVELQEEPFKSPTTPTTVTGNLTSQLDELASEAEAFQDAHSSLG